MVELKFIWEINQVKRLCTKTKFKMQDNIKAIFKFIFIRAVFGLPKTRYINVWTMINRVHEKIAHTFHGDFRR